MISSPAENQWWSAYMCRQPLIVDQVNTKGYRKTGNYQLFELLAAVFSDGQWALLFSNSYPQNTLAVRLVLYTPFTG